MTTLANDEQRVVSSPNGDTTLTFTLTAEGTPCYAVNHAGVDVVKPSRLGFIFKSAPPLNQNLTVADVSRGSVDETWTQPWGEVKEVRNRYNELRIALEETTANGRQLTLAFRVFDDGLGFRYELPAQDNLGDFEIVNEKTEFVLAGDHRAWWIPAYGDRNYEYLYRETPLSSVLHDGLRAVHTPLTMQTDDGLFLSIHEAALVDYASMTLSVAKNNTLRCDLVPWADGVRVKGRTPHRTPWRTIQIAEDAGDLITSNLILNLNDPNTLGDVSWVRPGKYVGIWWGMHLGIYTWGSGPRHGATTENVRRYIDFAAKYGFSGVLAEGWNRGWDGAWDIHGDVFDFTTPYDDFDIEDVAAYAAEKGVRFIGHNETSGAVLNYERQLEDAFSLYRDLGIDIVKTGYVDKGDGILSPEGTREWHHGQFMVRHYQTVLDTAAKYKIMLDVHEPVHATGLRRTYPNMMTGEGARGQEFNAWSADGGNPPEHTTILPFTRLLAGPMDFTPGIFDLTASVRPGTRVNTTLAKQLALYVVLYSPLQMAADLAENYEGHPAFQFIVDVPVDWEETYVLHAKIGDYVTIARRQRDSDEWYIGSITDEEGRTLDAELSFLAPNTEYVAEIYADADDAGWQRNPTSYDILTMQVNSETTLRMTLAPGGGQAIRLRPTQ